MRRPSTSSLLSLFACVAALPALAQEALTEAPAKPLWEAGIAFVGGRQPDYPAAAQSHTRALVAPFVVYRGPVLRIDEQGVRGRLVRHPDWEFDLAAAGAFNARNDDARRGMPGLDYLFGVGPQLVYKGWRRAPGSPSLHLRLLAMASTDLRRVHARGADFSPELRWRLGGPEGPSGWTASLQPHWASAALQRYYYEVAPAYATAARPAYAARGGYLGAELRLTRSWRWNDRWTGFASLGGMSLKGAANAGSPLWQRPATVGVALGLVWTPWHSDASASD
jgi:outer membrane scaffolding protein for murein synthesis (MipA/OmpV family)